MIDRLAARYGWRGGWLMLLGTVWVLFGLGVLLEPVPPRSWVLYEYLPPLVQATGWWATGALAIWQGSRGPVADDTRGHVALYLMPSVRLVSFALSWLIYAATTALHHLGLVDGPIGLATGWYAAAIWSLCSVMLAWVAGWPNPVTAMPGPPASALRED